MRNLLAVVAALLLLEPVMISVAAAAENPESFDKDATTPRKLKRAEKLLIMMKSVGISDPDVTALVHEIDGRAKNGHLMLYQERIADGTVSFRYDLDRKIGAKQLELIYKPDDSNTEYSLRKDSVMLNYKFKF